MRRHLIKVGNRYVQLLNEGKPEDCTMDTGTMLALAVIYVVFAVLAFVAP